MAGYPPYPPNSAPGSMPSPYPSQPGFNSGGYPPQGGGYPTQAGGYPPQTQPAAYPPQPGYPSAAPCQPGYPSAAQFQPGYPSAAPSQPGYPPAAVSQPGYPPAAVSQPGYPSTGQSHPAYSSAGVPQSGYSAQSAYPPAGQPMYSPAGSAYPPAGPNPTYSPSPSRPSAYPTQGYAAAGNYSSGGSQYQEQLSPTVRAVAPFDPRQDAEILRKAMKGFGTDEKAIINVLTKRSNYQRQEIANQFKSMYGKELVSDLKSELSGKLEELIVALTKPLPQFLAEEINYAIVGVGTKESVIIEIICTASNAEINVINNAYQRLYGRSLEQDLGGDTSGHFKRLLVSMCQARRSETMVDEAAAGRDAQALLSAGVLMVGTDESTFNNILCTRSYPHLRRVFMEYQRLSGHTMEKTIRSEFSGDIQDGLLAIVNSVEDKAAFFADRLRDALACMGTKDRQLIRVVVSRCEIDMQRIKQSYQQRYGKSLEQDISDDTSGDYKKALLALVSGY